MENNKNKKSVKFQGDMLKFCDFIQVFVFTRNHHLKHSVFIIETRMKNIFFDAKKDVFVCRRSGAVLTEH